MKTPMPAQQVREITDLQLSVFESFPPQIQVTAFGTVPTGGWTNPQLVPYTYVQAPPDGIYDFDFVATPPDGMATQAITPIRVRTTLTDENIKGIRVHAALNFKEVILATSDAPEA